MRRMWTVKRRWTIALSALLVLLLLLQLPSIYKRHQLANLRAAIEALKQKRVALDPNNGYTDYKGVIHVHSSLGGHSTGKLTDIVEAAHNNLLDFVLMTEHPSKDMDTSAQTLDGTHGGVLFIAGSEIDATGGDRLLITGKQPNAQALNHNDPTLTQKFIDEAEANNGLVFIAHPEQFGRWATATNYAGMEIYNMHAEGQRLNLLKLFFTGLWSFRSYTELLWMDSYRRPAENLKRWDEETALKNKKIVAIAGNDAHANLGISLQQSTGKKIFSLQLDPYERSFSIVRTHALVEKDQPLNSATLLSALKHGHAYVSFDVLADAKGFNFSADNRSEKKIMGDEIQLADGVHLTVAAPLQQTRTLLYKDGKVIAEATETAGKEFFVNEKGVYRVEVYLNALPKPYGEQPWIISNPIYVR